MRKNNCFVYPKTMRESVDGLRHYDVGKEKLPSVTTILKATESEDKKQGLADWAARIGEDAAEKIVSESAARGNGDAQDTRKIYFRTRLFGPDQCR